MLVEGLHILCLMIPPAPLFVPEKAPPGFIIDVEKKNYVDDQKEKYFNEYLQTRDHRETQLSLC